MRILLCTALVCFPAIVSVAGTSSTGVDKVRKRFHGIARTVYTDVLRTIDAGTKRNMVKELGVPEGEIPSKLADLLMRGPVFGVTERQAGQFLRGNFDNRGNRQRAKQASELLLSLEVEMPLVVKYLIDKVRQDNSFKKGLRLEFASRLLWFQAEQVRDAMRRAQEQAERQSSSSEESSGKTRSRR